MYKSIKKRDGRTAKFDRKKIEKAIEKGTSNAMLDR